jgi:uncharacterized protein (DUF302 family)
MNMIRYGILCAIVFWNAFLSLQASPQSGIVAKESAFSVAETIDRFEAILKEKNMTIFSRIDHSKNSDHTIPPTTLLIFGSPVIGTKLMSSKQGIGLDLPLKVLAYEEAGKVWLIYNDPRYLTERHSISDRMAVVKKMTTALKKFVDFATSNQKTASSR